MVPGSTVHVLFSKISFWLAVTTFFLQFLPSASQRDLNFLVIFFPAARLIIIIPLVPSGRMKRKENNLIIPVFGSRLKIPEEKIILPAPKEENRAYLSAN